MKRIFFLLSIFYFLASVLPARAAAQSEFTVDYNTTYTVTLDGSADVSNQITLTNNLSEVYATLYSLTLEGKKPTGISATQDGRDLPLTVVEEGDAARVSVSFPDSLVGKGKSRTFTIAYKLKNVAVQNGQVWDLTLPKIASPDEMGTYNLLLKVPLSFGNPAYISPDPRSKTSSSNFLEFAFNKEDLDKGVTAAFGEFQIFSFKLTYHLVNPYSKTGETEIALPPDTVLQRVYYENISPRPLKVRLDGDGNWLATFRLAGSEKMDVVASGAVQIFAKPQEEFPRISPKVTDFYLSEQPYWEVGDPQIRKLAKELQTPRAIFNYVTTVLNYGYSRVGSEAKRLGAVGALADPESALCMEFTDLFIALARSAGIPAREVNGYAYTEDPELQPLSLVADVLHAWPEFWHEEQSLWHPVDPTWENTTGGIDYFSKFDLSHITFAIHGASSTNPVPAGSYKLESSQGRDVEVEFGRLPKERTAELKITATPSQALLPFFPQELTVRISNSGPTAVYAQPIELEAQGLEVVKSELTVLNFLAPYSEISFKIAFKSALLPFVASRSLKLSVGDETFNYVLPQSVFYSQVLFAPFLILLIISGLLVTILRYAKRKA